MSQPCRLECSCPGHGDGITISHKSATPLSLASPYWMCLAISGSFEKSGDVFEVFVPSRGGHFNEHSQNKSLLLATLTLTAKTPLPRQAIPTIQHECALESMHATSWRIDFFVTRKLYVAI